MSLKNESLILGNLGDTLLGSLAIFGIEFPDTVTSEICDILAIVSLCKCDNVVEKSF